MFYKTLTGVLAGLALSFFNWLFMQKVMTVLHFNAPRLATLILLNMLVGVALTWFYTATKDFLPRFYILKVLIMSLGLCVFYIPMILFLFSFGSITFDHILHIFLGFILSFLPTALILAFFV